MSHDAAKDLEKWVPRLISVWRSARGTSGPPGQLTHNEIRDVSAGIRQLSLGLTRERTLAGQRYMDDPKLLGAYLLFYWPVSYAQARATLSELKRRPRLTLDLGSGPAPMAFAALDAGSSEVTAAERSKAALKLATALATEADESLAAREWSAERPLPQGTYDLITLGHVLNELFGRPDVSGVTAQRADFLERVMKSLNRGGSLLVIDPALKETSRALLEVRDVLVERGYAVRAPCFYRGACPALQKPTDWCHAERQWRMPPLVESLAAAAGLHKEALKMSYLILAPKAEAWSEAPLGRVFRIVSEQLPGKGRLRYMGCGPEGRIGLALQERHANGGNDIFFKLRRGDVIRIEQTEAKGDGLGLNEASRVEYVARAGQSLLDPP
ncbi:MAG: small ribosomal subunit Rsm22 family protein [Myxococcaceae bacterium]|nr:small ribosomal subunit Rsm22 family protein [Myxococcaceae bacterium]